MNRTIRTIISSALTLFLSLCVVLIILIQGWTHGLSDEKLLKNSLIESNYDQECYGEIEDRIKAYMESTDFPFEVVMEYLSYKQYYTHQLNYRNSAFTGNTAKIDYEQMEEELYRILIQYSNGEKDTEDLSNDLRNITAHIIELYQNGIETEFFQSISTYQERIATFKRNAILLLGGGSVFIIIWLFCLYQHKYKSLRYITAAFEAAFVTVIGIKYLIQGKIEQWIGTMGEGYYEHFLEVYSSEIAQSLWIYLFIVLIIIIILMFTTYFLKYHQGKKKLIR